MAAAQRLPRRGPAGSAGRRPAANARLRRVVLSLLVSGPLLAATADAAQVWSNSAGDRYFSADGALKWTSLLSRAPADTALYPQRWSSASLSLPFSAARRSRLIATTRSSGVTRRSGSTFMTGR